MKADMNAKGIIFNIQKFSVNDGPGIRTSVFFKGCPLRCPWCSNPESQSFDIQSIDERTTYGEVKSVQEVMDVVLQDLPFYEEGGGMTLTGGEFTAQPVFAENLLLAAKEFKINCCCETSGMAPRESFERLIVYFDHILFDVKHWDSEKHKQITGADNSIPLENLGFAVKAGKDVLPRIPVIPGFNDALEDAAEFAGLLRDMGLNRCQLLPFHQFGENKYKLLKRAYAYENRGALHKEDLIEYKDIFNKNGIEAFF